MKPLSKSSCFIYLSALFVTQVPQCDSKTYSIIDDFSHFNFCWRVTGESDQIQPNDTIVLAECNKSDDRQLFWINSYGYTDNCVYYADFHPKLNDTLVVGVNELKQHKRLRIQEPKEDNSAQLFYFDEHGMMGIGTDLRCHDEILPDEDAIEYYGHCLIVTNQGNHPSSGKIVHLKTLEEMVLKKNADWIWAWLYWWLVLSWCE